MKLEINELPTENFYDELLYIQGNYRQFFKKPTKKVKGLTKMIKNSFLILLFSLFLIFCISIGSVLYTNQEIDGNFLFNLVSIILACLIFSLFLYILVKHTIKQNIKNYVNSTVNIDQEGIEILYHNDGHSIKMNWEEIQYILVNDHTICALPKSITAFMIIIDRKLQDPIIRSIKKYGKESLIIDNSHLYK